MKTRFLLWLALVPLAAAPAAAQVLSLATLPQQQSNWCWAASGQMTMRYLGHDVSQCTEANNRFGQTTCCLTPSGACNNGGWPEYTKYHFGYLMTSNAALSVAQLQTELGHNRPIAFSWHWNGGGGHMMVLKGLITIPFFGQPLVVINDPEPYTNLGNLTGGTQKVMVYSNYVSGSGYTHWNDYYNLHYVKPLILTGPLKAKEISIINKGTH